MKIKTIGIKYPQQRLVLNKVGGVEYSKIQNYANPFLKRLKRFEVWKPLFDFDIDGYHTVNTVMLTNKPWCCSFEDYVPRGAMQAFWKLAYWGGEIPLSARKRIDRMVEILARPNCIRLMALSECNLNMQLKFYDYYNRPDVSDILMSKTCLLKVPQAPLVDTVHSVSGEMIKFVFVGNDFVRKGGREILDVFRELRKIRSDFELTLITVIENDFNYKFHNYQDSKEELDEIRDWAKQQDWIHIHSNIPNSEVIEIVKQCDVGLLPTWFDTYGYSVLEMQACGLPVISSNIRALPEINKNGWLLNLPVNFNNEIAIRSFDIKNKVRHILQKQMYDIVIEILEHKDTISKKGSASLEYIKTCHSPSEYADRLAAIYNEFIR